MAEVETVAVAVVSRGLLSDRFEQQLCHTNHKTHTAVCRCGLSHSFGCLCLVGHRPTCAQAQRDMCSCTQTPNESEAGVSPQVRETCNGMTRVRAVAIPDSAGLFELASKLASSLEEDGVAEVAALREEWAQDTVHTYAFLLGLDENNCHGADLKIYVHLAALRILLSVVALHVVMVE